MHSRPTTIHLYSPHCSAHLQTLHHNAASSGRDPRSLDTSRCHAQSRVGGGSSRGPLCEKCRLCHMRQVGGAFRRLLCMSQAPASGLRRAWEQVREHAHEVPVLLRLRCRRRRPHRGVVALLAACAVVACLAAAMPGSSTCCIVQHSAVKQAYPSQQRKELCVQHAPRGTSTHSHLHDAREALACRNRH